MIRIGRLPVQTQLETQPGLGIQYRYEAPAEFRVELVKTQRLKSGW